MHQQGLTPLDIAIKLSEKYNIDATRKDYKFNNFRLRIRSCISRYKKQNKKLGMAEQFRWHHQNKKEEKIVVIRNVEPSVHERVWDGTTEIKIAIIGDTHFGSKYTQFQHLNDFYDICKAEGIKDIYHVGDLTDGLKMRPGHEYELYVTSADDMVDDLIEKYPKRDGIITHFITGNHDASIYKHHYVYSNKTFTP